MSWYVRLHKSVPCYTFGNRYGIHTDLLQVLVCLGFWPRFCHVLLLNDKTWNSPLLWLLSRHLSLVQQYLGRVNREVAFRSQWVRSPGLSALRWAGALSIIRNVCSSWLSRRLTSIKNALKSSLFIPPIWAVWFTQKKSWHFYQADRQPDDTLILQLQPFHHMRPSLTPPPIYPS